MVQVITLRGHSKGVTSVAFFLGGKFVVSGSVDTSVKIWDAEARAEVSTRTKVVSFFPLWVVSEDFLVSFLHAERALGGGALDLLSASCFLGRYGAVGFTTSQAAASAAIPE